jgi:hypothetical protein
MCTADSKQPNEERVVDLVEKDDTQDRFRFATRSSPELPWAASICHGVFAGDDEERPRMTATLAAGRRNWETCGTVRGRAT